MRGDCLHIHKCVVFFVCMRTSTVTIKKTVKRWLTCNILASTKQILRAHTHTHNIELVHFHAPKEGENKYANNSYNNIICNDEDLFMCGSGGQ